MNMNIIITYNICIRCINLTISVKIELITELLTTCLQRKNGSLKPFFIKLQKIRNN